ncbi:MAG TPA: LamG-like jellyroll fold domain-containing protein, partial [Mycobacteriales bacterium]|nr:LamG-like jellyroll fold domain-containing protein [Mycobacteriales bacterium]
KRGSVGTAASQVVASKQVGDWVLLINSSNQLVLRRSTVADVAVSTVAVADTTKWHYLVATKDGASVHLYVDGADVTGAVSNQAMVDNTEPLAIGQSSSGAWFNGTIDEVALYNVALTAAQVASQYAAASPSVQPANTSPPTISGAALSGQIVSAVPGSWSGTAPISFAYQWRRCDSSGAGCVDIFAATGSMYTLGPADVGATVVVAVTASNSAGSATASSGPSAVVQAAPVPPANTAAPSLSGAAQAGSIVMVSSGGWSGTAPISYAYQWRRCDSGGVSCADIAGATASSYTAASADVGSTLVAVVSASNSAGSSSASSAPSAIVQAANVAPANTAAPTVSGAARAGQTLTASPGTWSGTAPISYAYQWQRCDSSGANCLPVAGATGQTYLLGSADVGSTIRAAVTASNSAGSSTASSLQTTAVTADAGCAPRSSAYSSAILSTAGLVSYWRLGESSGTVACDGAGSNNGVYQAGTTLGQPGAIVSDPDTAVALDGTAGWVQVPASSSLNVGDRFSIEAWVKRASVGTAANQVVAS